jgi:arylsulfatase A-like enzyme
VGCRPAVRGNGWNLLLITLETTRADHLGSYGYARDTSPSLDRLARDAVLFERLISVSPRTNPSLATLMTSRYPHEHGVRNLLLPLEPYNQTLAEILLAAGYNTGAVQTHPRLIAASGFAQGFQSYNDDFRAHPLADQACRAALNWIQAREQEARPWFLWLHLMDPHWTYEPPEEWRGLFGPEDPRPFALYGALRERRARIGPVIFQNRMSPEERQAFVDLYDAEIRYADAALGRLFQDLHELGLAEDTLIVVSADHGESLGEHDYFFEHGDFGTEPEIHVPLIVRAPRGLPGGVRVPWTVSSLDVGPTLTELLEVPSDRSFRGVSLVPLMRDPRSGEDRSCLGEVDKRFHEENVRREVEGIRGKWRWLRRGRYKLMHIPRASGAVDRPLYDLATDPGETRDATAQNPDIAASFGRDLDRWLAEDRGEEIPDYHLTPEAEEQLRALGYVN